MDKDCSRSSSSSSSSNVSTKTRSGAPALLDGSKVGAVTLLHVVTDGCLHVNHRIMRLGLKKSAALGEVLSIRMGERECVCGLLRCVGF